jgi:uncharacterized protein (DUF427 family)
MAAKKDTKSPNPHSPDHTVEAVPTPKRVRVFFAGDTVADTKKALLLRESGRTPVYYFPQKDVQMDLLSRSDRVLQDSHKGKASYWTLTAGNAVAENAAWTYSEQPADAPALEDYVAFEWPAMDAWFEEDEQVFVHPRDPFTRLDAIQSSRHVKVIIEGETIAETRRPVLLFETGLPIRYYILRADARLDLLIRSDTETGWPYKGTASHYSVRVNGETIKDIVWSYVFPRPEFAKIQNLICFYHERLNDFFVDGERLAEQ